MGETLSMSLLLLHGNIAALGSADGWDSQLLALVTNRPLDFAPKSLAASPSIGASPEECSGVG